MAQGHGFGMLLKRYRRAAGLTQEALAERAGYSAVYVGMLERGRREPLPSTVETLANALALSARDRDMLLAAAARAPSVSSSATPLIGRTRELELLARHLTGTGNASAPVLLLAGAAGIGKSRLLREAMRLAPGYGWSVLHGACRRQSSREPYALIVDALARHIHQADATHLHVDLHGCAWLASLLPELVEMGLAPRPSPAVSAEQERRLIVDATCRYAANVAGPSGTLLLLDDLQWADPGALDLLSAMVQRDAVRVIGAFRATEVAPNDPFSLWLHDVTHAGLVVCHALAALTDDEAAQVLDGLLAGAPMDAAEPAWREETIRRAAGIPSLLVHAVQELRLGVAPPDRRDEASMPPSLSATPAAPLIGRERDEASVAYLLRREDVRMVTLTGPGGVGKTRLALAVVAEMGRVFADGVVFVDLSPVAEPWLVEDAILRALGLRETGDSTSRSALSAYLRERQMLLVLDNVEQVAAAAPHVVDLLAECLRLKVLLTSRTMLHMPGERPVAVPPLALSDLAALPPPQALEQIAAIALFVRRAREVSPDFALTHANAAAVAAICTRLDGLPLAIELAAARVKLLPPPALLARLRGAAGSSTLRLLTRPAHELPERQQTLRRAIAWSYDLLSAGQQAVFRRLAAFAGGWTLEAAEAVCRAGGEIDEEILDALSDLVDHSLVRLNSAGAASEGMRRLGMLETIREFAAECLAASGEEGAVRQAHLAYYLELAEAAEPHLAGSEQVWWLERLEAEHDNLRAALRWAHQNGEDGGDEVRLATALWPFWVVRGYLGEGRRWLHRALAREGMTAMARARLLHGAGVLAYQQGDVDEALALLEESLGLFRGGEDVRGIALVLGHLGLVVANQGEQERAAGLYEESLTLLRGVGDKQRIADQLNNLGNVMLQRGDDERARVLLEESLAVYRELQDKGGIASALHNLGNVAHERGDFARARTLYEEVLTVMREVGDKRSIAIAINNLGSVAEHEGRYGQARTLYEESLALRRELGDTWGMAVCLANLGTLAADEGDTTGAMILLGKSLETFRAVDDKESIASCLESLARVTYAQGELRRAVRLLGAASALRTAVGTPLSAADRVAHDRVAAAARAMLGGDAFVAAWNEGQALPSEEAVTAAIAWSHGRQL